MLWLDIPLAEYYADLSKKSRAIAKFFTDLINPNFHVYFWPLLYFLTRVFSKADNFGKNCLFVLISIVAAVSIGSILKLFFGRVEPKLFFSTHAYGFTFFEYRHPFLSFPSGHAATAGAIAGAWAALYPRTTLGLSVAAFVLSYTRVMLHAHFFSDIIGGTLIGLIVSQWAFLLMKPSFFQKD